MKLIIAEKPSVARTIAVVLGANNKKQGYLEGGAYIVSWCIGHLVQLAPADAYDPRYAKWRRDDLPILPDPWQYIVSNGTKQQYFVLKNLMNDPRVDEIICATDAGREGELIFRLVYRQAGCRKPVKRLWISSLEESAVREGMAHLKDSSEYDALYRAALCRLHADWLVGINATRLWSLMYNQTYNIGRVMTPTLAMVVQRDAAIAAFVPEPYYTVQLSCGFLAVSERLQERAQAERIQSACHLKQATVQRIQKKRRTEHPPKLYDLTTLQRDANRIHGFTAQQTLDYVQSLYEKKLCTYPRTDSRFLPSALSAGVCALAKAAAASLPFASGLALPVHADQVVDDAKVTDHHAIIPTRAMASFNLMTLPQGERAILTMIAVRLLCAVNEPYVYEETTVSVVCEETAFSAKGKTVIQMGWMIPEMVYRGSIGMRSSDAQKDVSLPQLSQGQKLGPVLASVKEGMTTPAKHYTEDTLLAAMEAAGADEAPENAEHRGLGTPATRAGILEKLVKSGFIERKGEKKARQLIATPKGSALIAVVPQQIRSPTMTAEWEQRLGQIERGEADSDAFLADIRQMVCDLMRAGDRRE